MKTIKQSLRALREEDHRRALYAALVFIMLMILFFLLVSLEVPDPPPQEKIIELSLDDIDFEVGSQPEGGSESSDMNPQPTPVPVNETPPSQEYDTQDDSPVTVNSSNGNTNTESNQDVTPPVDNTFTFGNNGGGGSGGGNGPGFGTGDGVGGNGVGNSPGDGTHNPSRKVTRPPTFDAYAQEEGKIALDIYVDASGNVVKTIFKQGKSTSGSNYLIKLADKAAKTMKYDPKTGAGLEYVGYQIFSFKKS